ncbi:MBL fold metallo-hydrolase [Mucilaginibacter arboris]|uniref:MBL fold metallo-hydrolase n=1 Tax=Mucilaginibacter arboris TaxID=2682090 RepID=UPI0018DD966E|nr:MBL fold metallo-hydrolase [Mucilaginibacter arboris]
MVREYFLELTSNGLYCKVGDFYLDPIKPVQTAVISHAHADHAIGGHQHVFATAATLAFMELRYGKNAGKIKNTIAYHQKFTIKEVQITLIPAGHILGSAQVLMEFEGIKYLYTGDFKLQPDATCEMLEWATADVLITETTFANPKIKHPDQILEIEKLNQIPSNILLGAYALGKSQHLIQLINQFCPQKQILVHRNIEPINRIYEKFGYLNAKYRLYDRKSIKTQNNFIYLVPPFTFHSYIRATGLRRIFASGWENLQTNAQDSLYISDHADWEDILLMISKVQPSQVWTLHGNGSHLQQYFSGKLRVKVLN